MIFIADIDKCEPPPPRKIMVLINPHSGPGKAQEIFQSGVARMLEEADISYTMVVTGEAYNISYTMVVTGRSTWIYIIVTCFRFSVQDLDASLRLIYK